MDSQTVNEDLISACKSLVIRASNSGEDSLASSRTQKFLVGESGLLLSLPPKEDAHEQHIKRPALATVTSKSSHTFQYQLLLTLNHMIANWKGITL